MGAHSSVQTLFMEIISTNNPRLIFVQIISNSEIRSTLKTRMGHYAAMRDAYVYKIGEIVGHQLCIASLIIIMM